MRPGTSRQLAQIKFKVLEQEGGSEAWSDFVDKLPSMTDEKAIKEAKKLISSSKRKQASPDAS